MKNKSVYVGMSGGVDSSVAAVILKKQGYQVQGVFLECWDENEPGCTAREDKKDAMLVAAQLNIPFKVWDLKKQYKELVFKKFLGDYKNGLTPNPDVLCNSLIKFGTFYREVLRQNSSALIATGHYAKKFQLLSKNLIGTPKDTKKDQSYFLYQIDTREIENMLFPLDNLLKSKVRKIAKDMNLHNKDKPDSQGLCFVGDVEVRDVLKKYLKTRPGRVINSQGEVIGAHEGALAYTIGQRHNFVVRPSHKGPLYVLKKDVWQNLITVGNKSKLYKDEFKIKDIVIHISKKNFDSLKNVSVRIRNLGEKVPCDVSKVLETGNVTLEEKIFAPATGQHAVFYYKDPKGNDLVIGGGAISK